MKTDKAYDNWADSYDRVDNPTRDLEKTAIKQSLEQLDFSEVIEIGCGTGKNTGWLAKKASTVTGIDFSPKMLQKAREKTKAENVFFLEGDILKPWKVKDQSADLISCSLTLEHIANLHFIFQEGFKKLKPGGRFYICELHPARQYNGTKARFKYEQHTEEPDAFIHHTSEYVKTALNNGFIITELNEWFDNDDETIIPRLISFIFQKSRTKN
jgi:ubiquinone/menaquinone biosynthesis C-methylase UbiE